jgi:hypothetical protein
MHRSHVVAQLQRESSHRIGNEIAAADNMHVDGSARVLLRDTSPGYQLKLKAKLV